MSSARAQEGGTRSYLHPANVDGQDGGEKQHLKEEVGHQAHDGKETELLESERPVTSGPSGPCPARRHLTICTAPGGSGAAVLPGLGPAKQGPCGRLPDHQGAAETQVFLHEPRGV